MCLNVSEEKYVAQNGAFRNVYNVQFLLTEYAPL